MADCPFCNRELIKDDIIYESENFFVKVGFGLVTAGHVLITTKQHFQCFGELPGELDEEYHQLKQFVIQKITDKFAKPFLIEYGIWGQTVPHAHVHLIPTKNDDYEVTSIIDEMVIPSQVPFMKGTLSNVKKLYAQEKKYVYIEEDGQTYTVDVHTLPNEDKSNTPLDFRGFFPAKKSVKGIESWKNLSDEAKIKDEEKRTKTKELFSK